MMDEESKVAVLIALGNLMSETSEECWAAGWMAGTEDVLPALCWLAVNTNEPQVWGMGLIQVDWAKSLIDTAEQLGGWADYDMDNPSFYTCYKLHTPDWARMAQEFGPDACPPNHVRE